jgi:VWFA-related protein
MRILPGLFLIALLLAQEPPTIRTTTRLVQVNVVVRSSGKPVDDLKKEEFELLDNGKPQKIAFFALTRTEAGNKATQALPAGMLSNRVSRKGRQVESATVVLFDALNTGIVDREYARQQMLKFLETLREEDRVAVYVLGTQLRVLHDFTRDIDQLRRAIARYKGQPLTAGDQANTDWFLSAEEKDNPLLIEANDRIAEFENVRRTGATLAALEAIARHLSAVPGRKNLVWVSSSFPLWIGPQYESTVRQNAVQMSERQFGAMGTRDPNAGRITRNFAPEILRATRTLNNAGVAVYPVDARGLLGPPGFSAAQSSPTVRAGLPMAGLPSFQPSGIETLQLIAEETGGRAFYNTNDLSGAMRQAIDDSEVSYTLSFYPDSLDDKYHPIKVQVNRKGVQVRHRRGYMATAVESDPGKNRELELKQALAYPLDETGVGLYGNVLKQGAEWHVGCAVEANDITIRSDGKRWRGELDITIAQQSAEGRNLDALTAAVKLDLSNEEYNKFRAKVAEEGWTFWKAIEPKPNAAAVRIVVQDRISGQTGSLRLPPPR